MMWFFLLLFFVLLYFFYMRRALLLDYSVQIQHALSSVSAAVARRNDQAHQLIKLCQTRHFKEGQEIQALQRIMADWVGVHGPSEVLMASQLESQIGLAIKELLDRLNHHPLWQTDECQQLVSGFDSLEHDIAERIKAYNSIIEIYNIQLRPIVNEMLASFLNLKPLHLWQRSSSGAGNVRLQTVTLE